ncbi:hypothetical protein C3E78_12620 [Aeromicrobium chenweiae]|uniref:Uncharacterized protein n=1 Tax=Aeromicrobium chenweiae TaxID=2079793 RepID=A0A2S0WNQ4_9ACTN|nr:hypothetical protein C3E78_12620 [Aeromicrobium chenweiae]
MAAAIVAIEALTFVVLAVVEAAHISGDRVGLGVGTTLFLAVIGAGLSWAAWRVTEGDAWARSPLVFSQLIILGLAYNLRGDPAWLAPVVALPAVVALIALLSPPVTRALGRDSAV